MLASLFTRPPRRIALATLLFSGLTIAAPVYAAPQVVDAEDLDLSVPCLGRFEITVDPAMSDGVSVDSSSTGGAHLTVRTGKTQGSSKVLITSKSCAPAAKVSILIAPSVGVLIHDSHDTHIVINGTLASLEASLEAGQLDADTIQSLDLSLRGTEQVHIAHLNRAAQVVETGASGLVVDHADLDAFSAQLSETSHLAVTDGRFDVLTLMVENAASVRLGGTVNTATVSASGTGLVAIPTVSGVLTRTGTVQVGPVPAGAQTPVSPPPTATQPASPPRSADAQAQTGQSPPALTQAPAAPAPPSAPVKPTVTSPTIPETDAKQQAPAASSVPTVPEPPSAPGQGQSFAPAPTASAITNPTPSPQYGSTQNGPSSNPAPAAPTTPNEQPSAGAPARKNTAAVNIPTTQNTPTAEKMQPNASSAQTVITVPPQAAKGDPAR